MSKIAIDQTKCVGCQVKLKNTLGELIEGEIYAYDTTLNLLAIYESGHKHESSTRRDFKIIKLDCIKEFISLETPKKDSSVPFSDVTQPLPHIKLSKFEEREEEAVRKREQQLNAKVSTQGQLIFDAISKIVPCHWDNDNIVVLDSIVLKPPYKVENMSGGTDLNVSRVKKILEGEWKKINKK